MAKIKYNIDHYKGARVIFTQKDAGTVGVTCKYAMAGLKAGLRFFNLPSGFPLINIFIAPSRKEYDRLVAHLTKVPTSKGRLGQPQGHDLYLISPKAWPADVHPDYLGRDGKCDRQVYRQFIGHEIVHMIEEQFSPKGAMEIRPRWWSEGLAVYAAGQWKDRFTRRAMKEDLSSGRFPGIAELEGRNAYVWGWALLRHLEKRFGRKAFTRIMADSNTEDILGFLKLNKTGFEKEWHRAIPELLGPHLRSGKRQAGRRTSPQPLTVYEQFNP